MKKVISLAVSAALLASAAAAVVAEEKNPSVYVNNSEIIFADQKAVIVDDRTLVPARGVFEAMGATVTWDGEKRLVEVESSDKNTLVRLTIDDATMRVYDMSGMFAALFSGQDFEAPETDVELDVAPQILNDRTMIPLRAISEALDAQVDWVGEKYEVDITTADAAAVTDDTPGYFLTADKTTAQDGETVDVFVNVKNLPADVYVTGVTATVKYDKEAFEFVEASLVNGDTVIESATGAENAEFAGEYLKAIYVTVDGETAAKADGAVMKLTFKSIGGKEGTFQLSNGYQTEHGYNTSLIVDSADKTTGAYTYKGTAFDVSSDVLVINGADAEVSATPEATADVAATASPEATADAAATTEPEATADPSATAEPEAAEAPAETAAPSATPAA